MSPRAADLLESVRKKRSEAFRLFCPDRLKGCGPSDVKNVLVIAAASRSGSSFLHHLLSRHPAVVSLNGEGVVFEKLHGIGLVRSETDSDAVGAGSEGRWNAVAEDMLQDSGSLSQVRAGGSIPKVGFLVDSVQRLILQYPELDFVPGDLHALCAAALAAARPFSAKSYWLAVVRALGERFPEVEARHYDLEGNDPARDFPSADNALPPPFREESLEELPFVVPQPRVFPSKRELAGRTLLLKSSSDCYHMASVRAMFPKARFRFVLLTRNPAGAVSGLMAGWLSNGFYSRNVGRLEVRGYSRSERPWTRKWWNFDLPPGWGGLRDRSLQEVCAFQWRSANEHLLRDVKAGIIDDHIRVPYESFLDAPSLAKELARIMDFAGLKGPAPASSDRVMSVTPPAPQKWRKRKDLLRPLLEDPAIAELALSLGYDPKGWEAWP